MMLQLEDRTAGRTGDGELSPQEAVERLLARSATDAEFRGKLLSDPRGAIRESGYSVPEDLDLAFIENRHDATIVLPDPIDQLTELQEEELVEINGGATPVVVSVSARISSRNCAAFVSGVIISVATYLLDDE